MNIATPSEKQSLIRGEAVDPNWYVSWKQCAKWITENSQHGTTAERPTENLYIGRTYRDDTLGYHVHVHTVNPVVWHNESGAAV